MCKSRRRLNLINHSEVKGSFAAKPFLSAIFFASVSLRETGYQPTATGSFASECAANTTTAAPASAAAKAA